MNDTTVHIRGDTGEPGLYFTQERVVEGLLDLLRRGHVDEAVEVYARCSQALSDALVQSTGGDDDLLAQVANLLFRTNDYVSAATICERLGEPEKAAMLFARGHDPRNAARLYEGANDLENAAQMYERAGKFAKAADLYRDLGECARAAECYARAGNAFAAGEQFVVGSRFDLAVSHLQEVGADEPEFRAANEALAHCYLNLGALDRATTAVDLAATSHCTDETAAAWRLAVVVAIAQHDAVEAAARLARLQESGVVVDTLKHLAVEVEALKHAPPAVNEAEPADTAGGVVPFLEGFAHLRALPLFKALSLRDLRRVHAISTVVDVEPNGFLLLEGQPAPGMWLVLSGTVVVKRGTTEIARLSEGAHVGEMSLVDGGPASADVVAAKGGVRALRIERAGFERLLAANDQLALGVTRVLLREMCARLRNTSAIVAGRD